jgi:formylglycine-generating enzyme required for sulfatase activity
MRLVRFATGDAFCVDAREVSRADYAAFLQTPSAPAPVDLLRDPLTCMSKGSFVPGGGADCRGEFQADESPSLPITCVDMCDAMAYCSWRGRRLCGGPDGTKIGPRRVDQPADEWHAACSELDEHAFPYGDIFEPICNVASSALVPVDGRDDCTTPSGVCMLSGNAAEWVMQCRQRAGNEECLVRGGEFRTQDLSAVGCWLPPAGVDGTVPPMVLTPLERSPGVGIRCCSD